MKRPWLSRKTNKLYRGYDLSSYHEGRTSQEPEQAKISFAELLLDTEDGCLIRVRCDLARDRIAKSMLSINPFPMCDGAMNYARIWGRQAVYLCDRDRVKGDVWYKIDHRSGKKVIKKLAVPYKENLTFEEADKIIPERKFEFDGLFADLLEVLQKEGFTIIE